jgi:hypothetical protein
LRSFAQRLLILELPVLAIVLYTFWLGDANRVWSLVLLIPLLVARLVAYRRIASATPLNAVLVALAALCVLNVFVAPYERGMTRLTMPLTGWQTTIPWAWVMLGRPLMGIALYLAFVEHGRQHGMRLLVGYTVVLGLIVALVALVASQWNVKSEQLQAIIALLPQMRDLWLAPGGFNANEIAGGMAWLVPLCAGLALHRWQPRWLRVVAGIAFALLLLALLLGQSRLAIAGVIAGLALVGLLLPRSWRGRASALAGVALLVVFELMIVNNVFAPPGTSERMVDRDESGTAARIEMYGSVLAILNDHPLTGVGMNMYRDEQVRERYPVPTYGTKVLPHAHNEFLQLGADFGYPGLALYIALHGMALYMVWVCWRSGDRQARVIAVATTAGLLAHGIYGTGDAVALWDRFIFVYWGVLGLLGAQYVMVTQHKQPVQE